MTNDKITIGREAVAKLRDSRVEIWVAKFV